MYRTNPQTRLEKQNDIGCRHLASGQFAQAVSAFKKALQIGSSIAELHYNLSIALVGGSQTEAAIKALRRALKLRPDYVDALSNLGSLLCIAGRDEEGARLLRRALVLAPASAACTFNLGRAQVALKDYHAACSWIGRAVTIFPDYAEAWSTLGGTYLAVADSKPAFTALRRAVTLAASYPDAQSTLGYGQEFLGDREAALRQLNRALAADPGHADAHLNRGMVLLAEGRLKEGWPEFEWRWLTTQQKAMHGRFPQPAWQGQSLSFGRLLVWGEQGLGDELRNGSLLPDLHDRGVPLVIECDRRLTGLLSRTLPNAEVFARTTPPHRRLLAADIVAQVPFGSLPRWLRPRLADFDQSPRPFIADADRRVAWRQRLANLGPGPKIGIAWRSGVTHARAMRVHTMLDQWRLILRVPGLEFVNLQYGITDAEKNLALGFGCNLHSFPDLDLFADIEGIAALANDLDLVITTASTQFSIACTTGQEIWYLARSIGWLPLGTAGYPWYSHVRTFSCPATDPWDHTIDLVAVALAEWRDHRAPS